MAWCLSKHTNEFAQNLTYAGAYLLQVKWKDAEYGPVFNDTFLNAVFALQQQIEKVQLTTTNIILVAHYAYFFISHSTTLSAGRSVCRQMAKTLIIIAIIIIINYKT